MPASVLLLQQLCTSWRCAQALIQLLPPCRFMESYEARHSNHSFTAKVADIVGIVLPPLRMDSQVSGVWGW